jgi:hypothetical protein
MNHERNGLPHHFLLEQLMLIKTGLAAYLNHTRANARTGGPIGIDSSKYPPCVVPEAIWNYIRNAFKSFVVVLRRLHCVYHDVAQ